MADLILHHYPNSPFAEKIRLILGYKKLAWKSVIIPAIMPKPDLVALTGGYRRTPVLQIGADIYCDTALIADVLEQRAPTPTLYPADSDGMARIFAQWADSTLFWTAIGYAFQPAGVESMFANLPPEALKAFSADRAAMRGNAPRMAPAEATAQLKAILRRLEQMLAGGQAFLFGAAPTIADFSAYHALWYVRRVSVLASILDAAPALLAWADRMAAFGHHDHEAMRSEAAIAVAQAGTPADLSGRPFVDYHGAALGDRVAIMPTDYALDPVEGVLVQSTEQAFSLRRNDERAGEVVVHFPRLGFQLRKL